MSREALKFFHSYVREMIDIGGPNLPKTISARLGSKLARIYKRMGVTDALEGLRESYRAIKGNPEIEKIGTNIYQVKTKYMRRFCPIGGSPKNGKQAGLVQNSICQPFTMGFLSELDPKFKYTGIVEECILDSNSKSCRFTLQLEDKSST
jgi:hypothetical protein